MVQTIRAKLRALLTDSLCVLMMLLAASVPPITLRVVKEKPATKAAVDHGPLASSSADSERGINSSNVSHRRSAERAREILAFETPDDSISVKWLETGISRERPVTSSSQVEMPKAPDAFYPVDPYVMTALIEALQTISTEKSRLAMDCIRLPWSDEVLIVSSGAPLPRCTQAK